MDNTHDLIDRAVIHGHTREAVLGEFFVDRLHIRGFFHRNHVDSRDHDVLYVEVLELDSRADKLRFVFFEFAFVLGGFDDGQKFAFGNGRGLFELENLTQKPLPPAEHEVDRRENNHKRSKKRIENHRALFGVFFSEHFGRDFAENQHRHGHNDSGNGGGKRSAEDIYDIVADENCGEQLIEFLGKFQHRAGALVSVLRHIEQSDFVDRRESHFRGGKVSGKQHANDDSD